MPVRLILIGLGAITATPVLALVWPGMLDLAYGIEEPSDPMVAALLQHRGMLQAALGAALVWAALRPSFRVPAAVAAIVTKSTFIVLMISLPDSGWRDAASGVIFDLVTIVILAAIAVREARAD
ncbi:hypothetical protein SMC26_02220 [Actinomadura fulvescens]|uniref:DUF4345 domain-containing protein n=1 Tax=Actinomadura fulvescens TaxID=46160 RepID=A0ABN3PHL8_9ACTN